MSDDAMVPIAAILGRGEALTVAAMLDAAGIIVHLGGEFYSSVSADIIAIGGFRLTVPAWQYHDASHLLAEMLATPEPAPNRYAVRAIGRLIWVMVGSVGIMTLPFAALFGLKALTAVLFSPLGLLQLPVNPQGRGDYYISVATD